MAVNHILRPAAQTTAARRAATPALREVIRDSDRNRLFSGDGATAGGFLITDDVQFLTTTPAADLEHGDVIYLDSTAGPFATTLPSGAPDGSWVSMTDLVGNCGVNNVAVNADTTIDGSVSPYSINWQFARMTFVKSGGVWLVDTLRIPTHADTVAGWFPNNIGAVGTSPQVRADGTGFAFVNPLITQVVTITNLLANTVTTVTPTNLAGGSITNYIILDTTSSEFVTRALSEKFVAGPAITIESVTPIAVLDITFTGYAA